MKSKILIIDTDENMKRIREVLREGGEEWEVLFVRDPKEAMSVMHSTDVAVVVCGSSVPGLNCTTLPYEINKVFEDVNVIILNMNGEEVPREQFLKSTAFDMVQCEGSNCPDDVDIVESIEVAVTAKRMRDTGAFKKKLV